MTQVHVIRHALAGHRDRWDGPDDRRPLTEEGWEQADAIARRDAGLGFVRLVSSPFVRCVETLEPLRAATGIEIEARRELAEGMPRESLEEIVAEVAAYGPAAICVHGDQLVALAAGLAARGVRPEGPHDVRKGCTWALEVRDGSVAAARYLPPPIPADRATIAREA